MLDYPDHGAKLFAATKGGKRYATAVISAAGEEMRAPRARQEGIHVKPDT